MKDKLCAGEQVQGDASSRTDLNSFGYTCHYMYMYVCIIESIRTQVVPCHITCPLRRGHVFVYLRARCLCDIVIEKVNS